MTTVKGSLCEFGIEAGDKSFGGKPTGFSVTDRSGAKLVCPRNLSPEQLILARPDGKSPCPLYDQEKCGRAFFEQIYCPTRTRNTKIARQF